MSWLWNWKTVVVAALLGWAYLPLLDGLSHKWLNDPQYSHGILVPFFSLYLLYRRWGTVSANSPVNRGSRGGVEWGSMPVLGFAVLAVAVGCRIAAAGLYNQQLDAASMLISLAGVTLVCGGWPALKWSWPAILFLIFMVPLPYALEVAMGGPLQKFATLGSTFLLQTFGQPAVNEGNLILINEVQLGVAEACSGLRMLVTFAAFTTGAVILMERHWLVKVLVLASTLPIAMGTNIIRITTTGLAYVYLGGESSLVHWLHDLYGWLMMPVGLALLGLELWVFKHLLLEPKKVRA